MTRRSLIAAGIVGTAGLAALVPLSPAVGQESPPTSVINVELGDIATVGTRGAVAFVTVFYTCTPGAEFASISVRLTQRSGGGIATGFGGEDVTCDGSNQSITLAVTPTQKPFKKGAAFAQASGTICDQFQCAGDTDEEEIQLARA